MSTWEKRRPKVVADRKVVTQQIAGPNQEVVKLGPPFGASLGSVAKDEFP